MQSRLFLLFLLGLLPLVARAEYDFYLATLDQSAWTARNKPLVCELLHEVPYYGTAIFVRRPNKPLAFYLQSSRGETRAGEALLYAVPPAWMRGGLAQDLGRVKMVEGPRPIRLRGDTPVRMLHALEAGMQTVFSYLDPGDGKTTVKVGLSPIRFKDGLTDYLACVGELPPFTFDEVRFRTIYFPSGGARLRYRDRVWLDQVAQYLAYDAERKREVKEIRIIGHADSKGPLAVNEELARRRAEAVHDYLRRQGVSETLFSVESFGERRPLYSNLDPRGRSRNRRVTVELIKGD